MVGSDVETGSVPAGLPGLQADRNRPATAKMAVGETANLAMRLILMSSSRANGRTRQMLRIAST
jgi:hypothetical protein